MNEVNNSFILQSNSSQKQEIINFPEIDIEISQNTELLNHFIQNEFFNEGLKVIEKLKYLKYLKELQKEYNNNITMNKEIIPTLKENIEETKKKITLININKNLNDHLTITQMRQKLINMIGEEKVF